MGFVCRGKKYLTFVSVGNILGRSAGDTFCITKFETSRPYPQCSEKRPRIQVWRYLTGYPAFRIFLGRMSICNVVYRFYNNHPHNHDACTLNIRQVNEYPVCCRVRFISSRFVGPDPQWVVVPMVCVIIIIIIIIITRSALGSNDHPFNTIQLN